MAQKLLRSEGLRALLLALILIGVVMAGFGVVQFIRLSAAINDNVAYQINARGEQIDPQSVTEGQVLMAAGMALRELDHERDIAVIVGGVGLALLALGWLGREFTKPKPGAGASA